MNKKRFLNIKGALLDEKQLEIYLEKIASEHNLQKKSNKDTYPIYRLDDNFNYITKTYELLNSNLKEKINIHPAGEWLLDNYYVIDETYKTIKKELDVRELNVEQVVELYKQKGYSVSSTDDYQMIFERAVGTLEPNKYYIGDKDGYIAIYKSDVNGIPVIENEDDITQREVSLLMEIDQNMIRNYEMVFDTKEECEEALSNFIS